MSINNLGSDIAKGKAKAAFEIDLEIIKTETVKNEDSVGNEKSRN